MKLTKALPNTTVFIKKINGIKSKSFLEAMKINEETPISIIRNDFKNGITIKIKNLNWVLDKSIAKHIEVYYGL